MLKGPSPSLNSLTGEMARNFLNYSNFNFLINAKPYKKHYTFNCLPSKVIAFYCCKLQKEKFDILVQT